MSGKRDAVVGRTVLAQVEVSERAARAHAMKNCISVVRAIAHLVRPELSPRSAARVARLDDAIARMSELVEEELAPGSAMPPIERVSASARVESVRSTLSDRAEEAHVALLATSDGGWVRGRGAELHEALVNLVSNAIEATPAGGAVLVDACTTVDGEQVWTIQDTGAGIPPEVLGQLGAMRASFGKGGSGVGVAIAAEVFRAHGGLVRFESTDNSGTRVTIWLPGKPADEAAAPEFRRGSVA